QALVGPETQDKRGKAAVPGGRRPAADDELLTLNALHLEPGAIAGRAVGRISALGDDPFKAQAAGLPGNAIPSALFVVAVADGVAWFFEQHAQLRLSLKQRLVAQILALEAQQVEDEIGEVP